jgi:membrane protein required for beta-lactamase induction
MNKNRLKARTKAGLLDNAQLLLLAVVVFGTFFGLDALFHHTRTLIPVLAIAVCTFGAGSLAHDFLTEVFAGRRQQLRAAIDAADTKPEATR